MKKITAFFLAFLPLFIIVLLFITGMLIKNYTHVYVSAVEFTETSRSLEWGFKEGTHEEKEAPTIPLGSKTCFVDEIYVLKRYRNKGIGTLLFEKMEEDIKDKCEYIKLVTSTKDHNRIIHFYEDILKMNFWSACFFKKV